MRLFGKDSSKKTPSESQADFYEYDELPEELRRKIFFRMGESLNSFSSPRDYFQLERAEKSKGWHRIIYEVIKQKGTARLAEGDTAMDAVGQILYNCLMNCDVQDVLIVIEEFFAEMQRESNRNPVWIPSGVRGNRVKSPTLYDEVNSHFNEYHIGYEFIPDAANTVRARRIDSTYTHEQMVKPTLALLNDLNFKGPSQEFNEALDEYNNQNYSNAIASANKAFESMMKAVLQELQIPFNHKAPASGLIKVLFDQGVIPRNLESLSTGIRNVLASGLPTIRNEPAIAHGTGRDPREIEKSYAGFAIHLCATYILFLGARYKERRP